MTDIAGCGGLEGCAKKHRLTSSYSPSIVASFKNLRSALESASNKPALSDPKLPVKLKLSALWTSVMFCYIYADYFELFKPGRLEGIIAGNGPIGPTTQGGLVVASLVLAIPSVMIFLSIALQATVNRLVNISFGSIYTIIIIFTASRNWAFMKMYGVVEVVLTGLVVWYALKWPKQEAV